MSKLNKLLQNVKRIPSKSKYENLTEEQLEVEIERLELELEIGKPTLAQLRELIAGIKSGKLTFERYNEIIISAGGRPRTFEQWLEGG